MLDLPWELQYPSFSGRMMGLRYHLEDFVGVRIRRQDHGKLSSGTNLETLIVSTTYGHRAQMCVLQCILRR
jgi:hypothetical protein